MNVLTIILIVLGAVAACIICYYMGKYKKVIPVVLGLLAIVFVGLSAKCFINLNDYYTASGGVIGYLTGLEPNNQVQVEVLDKIKVSLNNVVLLQETNTDTYSAQLNLNDIIQLEKGNKYTVQVNNEPCSNTVCSIGTTSYVRGDYVYQFQDDDFEELCTDTLTLNFAFYGKGSELKVSTNGGQAAVDYWNKYFSRNDFYVEIATTEYIRDTAISFTEGDVSNYHTITYIVDETEYATQVFSEGNTVTLLSAPEKNGYVFDYWADAEGNKVNFNSNLKIDTTLYAVYIEAEPLPWIIEGDTITGYTGTSTELVFPTSYSIAPNGEIIAGDTYAITKVDINFKQLDVAVESIIYPDGVTYYGTLDLPTYVNYIEFNGSLYSLSAMDFGILLDTDVKLVLNVNSVVKLFNYLGDVPGANSLMDGDVEVYVPDALLSKYKAAEGWLHIKSHIHSIKDLQVEEPIDELAVA